jgi:hypothetical protein
VFTFLGLAFLNGMFGLPIFADAFARFIPWINILLVAEILLDVYLLFMGRWNVLGRVSKVVLEAASLGITVMLIRLPGLKIFTDEALVQALPTSESVAGVITAINLGVTIALVVVLIIQGIELAKALYGLLRINYRTK